VVVVVVVVMVVVVVVVAATLNFVFRDAACVCSILNTAMTTSFPIIRNLYFQFDCWAT
jgi:hypothetical protein